MSEMESKAHYFVTQLHEQAKAWHTLRTERDELREEVDRLRAQIADAWDEGGAEMYELWETTCGEYCDLCDEDCGPCDIDIECVYGRNPYREKKED